MISVATSKLDADYDYDNLDKAFSIACHASPCKHCQAVVPLRPFRDYDRKHETGSKPYSIPQKTHNAFLPFHTHLGILPPSTQNGEMVDGGEDPRGS